MPRALRISNISYHLQANGSEDFSAIISSRKEQFETRENGCYEEKKKTKRTRKSVPEISQKLRWNNFLLPHMWAPKHKRGCISSRKLFKAQMLEKQTKTSAHSKHSCVCPHLLLPGCVWFNLATQGWKAAASNYSVSEAPLLPALLLLMFDRVNWPIIKCCNQQRGFNNLLKFCIKCVFTGL